MATLSAQRAQTQDQPCRQFQKPRRFPTRRSNCSIASSVRRRRRNALGSPAFSPAWRLGAPAQTAAPPSAAEPLTIVFASESGNCERLACDMAKTPARAVSSRRWSTWPISICNARVGEAPDDRRSDLGRRRAAGPRRLAYADLMGDEAPRLEGVEFAVLALGDTAYVEFCAIGKAIDERLAALGAKRVVDRVDCDLDFAALAADWIEQRGQGAGSAGRRAARTVIAVDFGKAAAATEPRHRRGGSHRAHQSQFVSLRQGDDPPRAHLRRRSAALQARRLA